MFHLEQVVLTMTTNKQSEKRESSIMVIEDKTLKTLTKKENKMNNKPNYSLNKTIKSISTSKKYPEYELQKNAMIEIKLPNGMSLSLSSDEKGEYCSMSVYNHIGIDNSGKFETEVKNTEYTNSEKRYSCKTDSIVSTNYVSFFKNETERASGFRFELKEFNKK